MLITQKLGCREKIVFVRKFFCTGYNIKIKMIQVVSWLLASVVLINEVGAIDWQGAGNLTQDNITEIRGYITTNFSTSWTTTMLTNSGDTTLSTFAQKFSDHLNSLWDRAWNVVVAYQTHKDQDLDTVLYGYGFRDHWMWINGYMTKDSHAVSFIIWKDYNCITWVTHNKNTEDGTPFSYTNVDAIDNISAVISRLYNTVDYNDIWKSAKKYADTLNSDSGLKSVLGADKDFTIIMSQAYYINYYARFCCKDYFINYDMVGQVGGDWGEAIIMQMR